MRENDRFYGNDNNNDSNNNIDNNRYIEACIDNNMKDGLWIFGHEQVSEKAPLLGNKATV